MHDTAKKIQPVTLHTPDPLFVNGYIGWFVTARKGRGVLALRDIAVGVVIDRNPVIVMASEDMTNAQGAQIELDNYVFRWGPENAEKKAAQCACALGSIPLCNHAANPNARLQQDHENSLMELRALRDIRKGEEITIDYDTELWFDPA